MPKKKKILQEVKDKRRKAEAEKANQKSRRGAESLRAQDSVATLSGKTDSGIVEKYSLPVTAIKKDLVKNGIYMLFVIAVLVVLKVSDLSF